MDNQPPSMAVTQSKYLPGLRGDVFIVFPHLYVLTCYKVAECQATEVSQTMKTNGPKSTDRANFRSTKARLSYNGSTVYSLITKQFRQEHCRPRLNYSRRIPYKKLERTPSIVWMKLSSSPEVILGNNRNH